MGPWSPIVLRPAEWPGHRRHVAVRRRQRNEFNPVVTAGRHGGEVKTLVGVALFEFGDKDGIGRDVRLQHALGVAYHDGKIYVADTYNSKIKVLDPKTRECVTFVGGEPEGWYTGPTFSEPAGISYADGKLYLADTNAHRIRVVDLKTRTVSTLKLTGVEAPRLAMP